jgi:hypothetical protein
MLLPVVFIILIILFILFKRSFNKYASGLREEPTYLFWLITRFINFKGWSTEEYCLCTTSFKSNEQPGYLSEKEIPLRNQSRPKMLRAIPHRQLTQQAPDHIMYEIHKHIESISIPKYSGKALDNLLLRGKSVIEYTGADGIFLPNANQNTFTKGEFAHVHSNDGSLHMILHPSDAILLINKQWAERFPLAGINLFNKIIMPDTYVLIYAPQSEDDLKIWKIILNAAINYNRNNQNKY